MVRAIDPASVSLAVYGATQLFQLVSNQRAEVYALTADKEFAEQLATLLAGTSAKVIEDLQAQLKLTQRAALALFNERPKMEGTDGVLLQDKDGWLLFTIEGDELVVQNAEAPRITKDTKFSANIEGGKNG